MKLRLIASWRGWSVRRKLAAAGGGMVVVGGLAVLLLWLLLFRGSAPPAPSVSDRISTLSALASAEDASTATTALPDETAEVVPSTAPSPSPAGGQETSPPPPSPSNSSTSSAAASSAPSSSASASSVPTSSAADPPSPPGSIDGVWIVDTTIGDFEDFSSSYAGYRVGEELANIGTTEAVGRTPMVSGFLEIDGSTVLAAEIEVDLPSIVSDRPRRDGLVRQSLEADRFPTARFVLNGPLEIGSLPPEGEEVRLTAPGDFSVHGVTRPVNASLEAARQGDLIVVGGSFEIRFDDYDIVPPRVAIVLSVADVATVEWLLNFTR